MFPVFKRFVDRTFYGSFVELIRVVSGNMRLARRHPLNNFGMEVDGLHREIREGMHTTVTKAPNIIIRTTIVFGYRVRD